MIVWGGFRNDLLGDAAFVATGGRYDPVSDTWQEMPMLDSPAGRAEHTGVWTGTEFLIWGGTNTTTATPPPPPLVQGGRYNPSTNTWSPMSIQNAPSATTYHTSVWTGREMIVWGGSRTDYTLSNSGARYDPVTDTWSPVTDTHAPQAREMHSAIWTGTSMIVWGGSAPGANLDSGGRYDPAVDAWETTSTTNAPSGRYGHSAFWTGDSMLVWGRDNGQESPITGGRYDAGSDSWTPTSTGYGPSDRYGHTAIWTGNRMLVWGGVWPTMGGVPDMAWNYDPVLDSWSPASAAGAVGRGGHTAVWTGEEMLVWGGTDSSIGERYRPATETLSRMAMSGAPSPRNHFAAVWTGKQLIVWGGDQLVGLDETFFNSGARYDPRKNVWKKMSKIKAPTPRTGASAVWTGKRMLVWGGGDQVGRLNTGSQYDPSKNTWKSITLTNAPEGRLIHAAVWTGTRMLVWGGYDDARPSNVLFTGGLYDPVANTWTTMATQDGPATWGECRPVWTGSRMIVFGGSTPDFPYSAVGGLYDPDANSWTPTSTVNAPAPRYQPSAVWTGSQVILWGGLHNDEELTSGGRYTPAP